MCVHSCGLSPWINFIGVLFVIFLVKNNKFPFRKCIQIEIWTYGTSSNIRDYTLKLPICRILASGPFSLQPYYSRGKNMKFYSTSHVNTFLMMTSDRGQHCHSEKTSRSPKKQNFQILSFFSGFVIFFKKCAFKFWTFTLNKIYRHTIPYFWSLLWVISFPEMYSNRNLNVWNIFKY